MDTCAETYYLSSLESRIFEPVRTCRIKQKVTFTTGKTALLAHITPLVIGQAHNRPDIAEFVLAARHKGAQLDPISEFPCFVHIAIPADLDRPLRLPLRAEDLVTIGWGELYRTRQDAEQHHFG